MQAEIFTCVIYLEGPGYPEHVMHTCCLRNQGICYASFLATSIPGILQGIISICYASFLA